MAIADWDWGFAGAKTLDATWYKSAPTSLKISGAVSGFTGVWLSRTSLVQNVPQGEMRFWYYRIANATISCVFRNQAALGVANLTNSYMMYATSSSWDLWKFVAGVWTNLATIPCSMPNGSIGHYRFVWWNGESLTGAPALAVSVYKEGDPDVWTLLGTVYHTDNLWKDSSINRCGYYYGGAGGNSLQVDDTEIWTPTV